MPEKLMTPVFRVSYPNVFKARKNELSGKDEYSCVALFAKGADLNKLKKAAEEAIVEKWGADKKKWPANIRSPFRDQGEREKAGVMPPGYEKGAFFINLKSQQRPGVVNSSVEEIIDESEFYAGCFAQATVSPYAYDAKGNRGVAFGLRNIQKVKDGDHFTSRSSPVDDFQPIAGSSESSDVDSTSVFG